MRVHHRPSNNTTATSLCHYLFLTGLLLIASWSAQVHGQEDADFVVPETSISEIQESSSSLLPESLEPDKWAKKIISQPKQQEQETITLLFTRRRRRRNHQEAIKEKAAKQAEEDTSGIGDEAPTDVPNDAPTDAPYEEERYDSGSGDSVSTSGIGDESLEPDKWAKKIISQPKQQEQETITLLFTRRRRRRNHQEA